MDIKKTLYGTPHKISLDPSGIDICGNGHIRADSKKNECIIDIEDIYISSDISANGTIKVHNIIKTDLSNNIYQCDTIGGALPRFSIILWTIPNKPIPPGWQICDGTELLYDGNQIKVPNLTNKFIRGYNGTVQQYKDDGDELDDLGIPKAKELKFDGRYDTTAGVIVDDAGGWYLVRQANAFVNGHTQPYIYNDNFHFGITYGTKQAGSTYTSGHLWTRNVSNYDYDEVLFIMEDAGDILWQIWDRTALETLMSRYDSAWVQVSGIKKSSQSSSPHTVEAHVRPSNYNHNEPTIFYGPPGQGRGILESWTVRESDSNNRSYYVRRSDGQPVRKRYAGKHNVTLFANHLPQHRHDMNFSTENDNFKHDHGQATANADVNYAGDHQHNYERWSIANQTMNNDIYTKDNNAWGARWHYQEDQETSTTNISDHNHNFQNWQGKTSFPSDTDNFNHKHTFQGFTDYTGGGKEIDIRPSCYNVVFIMKL
tara:strand:- start:2103 stop:3554 length:1452 start_codon:yes stop_codon:yes gene_type:complete